MGSAARGESTCTECRDALPFLPSRDGGFRCVPILALVQKRTKQLHFFMISFVLVGQLLCVFSSACFSMCLSASVLLSSASLRVSLSFVFVLAFVSWCVCLCIWLCVARSASFTLRLCVYNLQQSFFFASQCLSLHLSVIVSLSLRLCLCIWLCVSRSASASLALHLSPCASHPASLTLRLSLCVRVSLSAFPPSFPPTWF